LEYRVCLLQTRYFLSTTGVLCMKKYNCILAGILVALSTMIFVQTRNMLEVTNNMPGPGIWPRALAVIMLLCAVCLLYQTFFRLKSSWSEVLVDFHKPGVHRVCLLFGLFVTFGIALNYLGFVISSLMFIPAVMVVLGERRWKHIAVVDVTIVVFIYLIFEKILNTVLPAPFFM